MLEYHMIVATGLSAFAEALDLTVATDYFVARELTSSALMSARNPAATCQLESILALLAGVHSRPVLWGKLEDCVQEWLRMLSAHKNMWIWESFLIGLSGCWKKLLGAERTVLSVRR
jgi:hypothetical protein